MTTQGEKATVYYVATNGDDTWSGKLAAPNAAGGEQSSIGEEGVSVAEKVEGLVVGVEQRRGVDERPRRRGGGIPHHAGRHIVGHVPEVGGGEAGRAAARAGEEDHLAERQQRRVHREHAGVKGQELPLAVALGDLVER